MGSDVCYACARPGHVRRDCPSLRDKDKVRSTGVVAGSSSSARPPRPRSQVLEGGGRDQREMSSLRGSQRHTYALAGQRNL